MSWWYLSFAAEDGWRGAAIVEAETFMLAVLTASYMQINPGGEVWGHEVPKRYSPPPEPVRNRLLTIEDIERHLGRAVSFLPDNLYEKGKSTPQ